MSSGDVETRSGVQVIARAAQVLRAIKQSPGGLTQAELAATLGLPRTTVFRIVSALEEEELVAPGTGPRGRYRIGPEVGRLASAATRDLVGLMQPYLAELNEELTETVDLSVLDGGRVLFVDQVDAPHRLRAASAVGEYFPPHTCAPGKAMLAAMGASRAREVLPPILVPSTPASVTSLPQLREQLVEIRESGVAFDYEEQNDGICAAGVAFWASGTLAAVSVPIPAQRFTGREAEISGALLAMRDRVLAERWA